MRTVCVGRVLYGDLTPETVGGDFVQPSSHESTPDRGRGRLQARGGGGPVYKPVNVEALKRAEPDFTVTFTEDKNGFYINGSKYAPDASPMTTVRIGTYQHWRIGNRSAELHPFHIHQVHFLAYAENGMPLVYPVWLDTVNIPYGGPGHGIVHSTIPTLQGIAVLPLHPVTRD